MMARAELLLEVVEAHRPLTPRTPVENGSVPVLLVANKADLGRDQSLPAEAIAISARSGEGLEALEKKMEEALLGVPERPESPLAINARQKASLTRAAAALARTREALSAELGLEVVSIELREALQELAEVIGATTNEDILTRLFQNFCIGK
jgi:tRNA modification GTPase